MASLTSSWYRTWQNKLQRASVTSLRCKRVLCAFNALIDKVVYYDQRSFHFLSANFESEKNTVRKKLKGKIQRIDTPQMLLVALITAFKTGKAMHLPTNFTLIQWLENTFRHCETAIGGQAGIISNQLALIGAKPIVYTPQLSPKLASLFSPRVKFPRGYHTLQLIPVTRATNAKETRTNWIIEFQKGDKLQFAGEVFTASRSNRIILSSPCSQPPLFDLQVSHLLPELGEQLDAAILSGYQALQPMYEDGTTYQYYLSLEELYLELLKSHKNIPLHLEYVSTPFKDVDAAIYEHITKHIDSFGLNEIEIVELAEKLKQSALARNIVKKENVVTLHAASEKIMEKLALKRLHVHNLGYHLLLLKKPVDIAVQKKQINALLFGSLAATSRAIKGSEITRGEIQNALDVSINETSLNQMVQFAAHLSLTRVRAEASLASGIFDVGNHFVLIAPGQASTKARKTTGLGDVLSSCSFLAGL